VGGGVILRDALELVHGQARPAACSTAKVNVKSGCQNCQRVVFVIARQVDTLLFLDVPAAVNCGLLCGVRLTRLWLQPHTSLCMPLVAAGGGRSGCRAAQPPSSQGGGVQPVCR
jgi:hypothetical protein